MFSAVDIPSAVSAAMPSAAVPIPTPTRPTPIPRRSARDMRDVSASISSSPGSNGFSAAPGPSGRRVASSVPAPQHIHIPGRARSVSRVSALSSSPTSTPFCLVDEDGDATSAPSLAALSTPGPPSPGTKGVPKAKANGAANGGPKANGKVNGTTPSPPLASSKRASPPSPSSPLPPTAASPPSPTNSKRPQARRMSKKDHKPWMRIFDLDNMLGALDPNRLATASAPDPIRTVVFGAETDAGLAVCRALLAAKRYALVALMVDDATPATEELREQGVKIVQVDMDNPASYVRELVGAKAVYLSTNVLALHAILQHQAEPQRTEIARRADRCQLAKAANACMRAKVAHLVFRVNSCGHEIVDNVLGKDSQSQFVVKDNEAPEDLTNLGIPVTILHTTVPYDRMEEWIEERPDGLVLTVPVPEDTKLPMFAIEQTGEYVLAAFRNPKKWVGKEMYAVAEVATAIDLAKRLSTYIKRPVRVSTMTRDEFNSIEVHEKLACKWKAWSLLVGNTYDFDALTKETKQDVQNEWSLREWAQQQQNLLQRLKRLS